MGTATANAIELLIKRLMFDQVQSATAFLLGNAGNGLDSLMKLDKKLDKKLDSAATSFLSLPLPPMTRARWAVPVKLYNTRVDRSCNSYVEQLGP